PHRVVLPLGGRAEREALLRGEPLVEDGRRVDPGKKLLRRLLVLRITHHHVGKRKREGELPARALGKPCVEDVLPQRCALFGQIRLGLLLGFEIDRGAIVGRAAGTREESPVVARIVPGEPAFVVCVLPETDRELHRLDRLLAVECYGLAVRLELLAAPRPEKGIPEDNRVAKGVAERLPHRAGLGLELLPGGAVFLPRLRKLPLAVSDL